MGGTSLPVRVIGAIVALVVVVVVTVLVGVARSDGAGSFNGTVVGDGVVEQRLTIDEDGYVRVDVRATHEDGDLVAAIVNEHGRLVARNDDRGMLADELGGDWLDPYIDDWLRAGEYTIVVSGYAGRDTVTGFTASFSHCSDVNLERDRCS